MELEQNKIRECDSEEGTEAEDPFERFRDLEAKGAKLAGSYIFSPRLVYVVPKES